MFSSISTMNRRGFLAAAATAAVSPLVLSSSVLGREGVVPPSEQLVMALIGYGNRGSEIIGGFLGDRKNFRVVAVCDCYE
ncbi:MAG: twin-arginine translocation signal domain-containing protein, partial [Planctomycetaceae bacterium]|nr:twin-arginine translocation signal domain-containing protein [Planctomycetaceae bacterium]